MHVSLFLWGCVGTLRLQALPHSTPPALSLGKCKLLLPLRRSNCCNCTPAIEDPTVRHTLMKLFNAFKSKVGALNDLSVVKESDGVWRGYRHYLRSTCPRQNHREREREREPHPTTSRQFPCLIISERDSGVFFLTNTVVVGTAHAPGSYFNFI